jgi:hypothetical protein
VTPKSPDELRKQIEEQAEKPVKRGRSRTAEGQEVRTPKRGEFFKNLKKASESEKD